MRVEPSYDMDGVVRCEHVSHTYLAYPKCTLSGCRQNRDVCCYYCECKDRCEDECKKYDKE